MNAENLKQLVLAQLDLPHIPENAKPFYPLAVLDEVCETITAQHPDKSLSELTEPTLIAYQVALAAFRGMVNAGFQFGDQVTLNYRGEKFVFRSPIGQ